MSIQSLQSNVGRIRRDLASLEKRQADEAKKEIEKTKRISQIERSITRSTSLSMLRSKQQQIMRLAEDIARIQKTKADLSRRIADKTSQLHGAQQALLKEEERERKKVQDAEKRRRQDHLAYERALNRELSSHQRLLKLAEQQQPERAKRHDVFICHASENKAEFVRPLAKALRSLGLAVWYDEFELSVGDNLRRSIDRGLTGSRYGVVVLSEAFFAKNWPQYELDGLVAKEMDGAKVVLPIWHRVTKDEVTSYSPSLANKVALNSSMMGIQEIALEIARVVRK
jgi:hypothetical protein